MDKITSKKRETPADKFNEDGTIKKELGTIIVDNPKRTFASRVLTCISETNT